MGWIFSPKSPRQLGMEEAREQVSKIKKEYPKIQHLAVFAENTFDEVLEIAREGLFDYLQIAAEPKWLKEMRSLLVQEKSKTNRILAAVRVRAPLDSAELLEYGSEAFFILDSFVSSQPGGTGKRLDPAFIREVEQPYLLAGGINPENVLEALFACRACGVDISSGLESGKPGYKEEHKIKLLMEKLRSAKARSKVIPLPTKDFFLGGL